MVVSQSSHGNRTTAVPKLVSFAAVVWSRHATRSLALRDKTTKREGEGDYTKVKPTGNAFANAVLSNKTASLYRLQTIRHTAIVPQWFAIILLQFCSRKQSIYNRNTVMHHSNVAALQSYAAELQSSTTSYSSITVMSNHEL